MKIFVCAFMMLLFMTNVCFGYTMTDYEAVNNMIVSERLYRVSHRNKELAECYAEDAKIHTSWQSGGINTFAGHSAIEAQKQSFNVNRCGGALIHMNGNHAFVEYPSTTTRSVNVNGVEAVLTSYMRLLYRVEKRNDTWKIVEMLSLDEADDLPGTDRSEDVKRIYDEAFDWLNESHE